MKIGTFASITTPIASPQMIIDIGRRADEMGLDSLWMGEHVVLFDEMEFPYPGSPDGRLPIPEGCGLPDTVVTLSFLASVTTKLRFGTGVSLIPQRNPIYTANEFATLDYLTGGRVDLGVGVGWCKEEVLACGYRWEDRGERCNEMLELMIKLWTEPVTTHHGKHFDVEGCRLDPKPIQTPHIPLIIGGYSPAAMRRAALYGNGWLGFGTNPEQTGMALAGIDTALAAQGRSRDDFEIIVMPAEANADNVREFEDVGVDRLVPLLVAEGADAINRRFDELGELAHLVR
jgi:probable F420-dependent oxidoreductase